MITMMGTPNSHMMIAGMVTSRPFFSASGRDG